MTIHEKVQFIIENLTALYPDAVCSLAYEKPYELLFATRLAAQCTDARVNLVTPVLYSRYPTLEAIAEARVEDVEEIISSCGLFHTKARDIVACAQMLVENYGGIVPDTVEELVKLPGIGRKTANLIVGDVYGKPAIVTDTHCIRISNRLGLVSVKEPAKVERALRQIVPPEAGSDLCHRFVLFGRDICTARAPKCAACPLAPVCQEGKADV